MSCQLELIYRPFVIRQSLSAGVLENSRAYPVTKVFEANTRICLEEAKNIIVGPPALVLKGLWQIPMVQCDHRLDTCGPQGINEAVIIRDALGVDRLRCSIWQNAGPRQGEPVVAHLELWGGNTMVSSQIGIMIDNDFVLFNNSLERVRTTSIAFGRTRI